MNYVETETLGQIMVVKMNRPERLNALGHDVRSGLSRAFQEFRDNDDLEVAVLTGAGRAFCAGEDMKESVEQDAVNSAGDASADDPFMRGTLEKPVIAAINGYAMGGGFLLVERTDLRVAAKGAIFEISEAKRWLLGGYDHGFLANLPHPVATEMAFGFRFTAERLYEIGFLNRLTEPEELLPTAFEMAEHLLTLPPASRVNTLYMMRQMRPQVASPYKDLAEKLHQHGALDDRMESRRAFAEKREPNYKGWDDPSDRYNLPRLGDEANT
jgi:enoyl-CoA hydratase/carnithine racemase